MARTYRRRPPGELEAAVRRVYADRAAAGMPRPTGDEMCAAVGDAWGVASLNAAARRLRAAGGIPDLPRGPRAPSEPAGRDEAEARKAAMAAGRAAAAAMAAGRRASAAVEDLTPGRRWAREHLERERRLGIGADGRTSRR